MTKNMTQFALRLAGALSILALCACGGGDALDYSSGGSGGSGGSSAGGGSGGELPSVSHLVDSEGAEIQLPAGGTLTFYKGALDEQVEVTVTQIAVPDSVGDQALSPFYRFEPAGLKLFPPAVVSFPVDLSGLDETTAPQMMWASEGEPFEPLETVITASDEQSYALASVSHFSKGGVKWNSNNGICCKNADGSFSNVPTKDACANKIQPPHSCWDICCGIDAKYQILPLGQCLQGGIAWTPEFCEVICCDLGGGNYASLTMAQCTTTGGQDAPQEDCDGKPNPNNRWGHTITPIGGDTWLMFGGTDGQTIFNDLWKITFDPVTTDLVFEEVKPSTSTMPAPRAHHAAAFADGKVIMTGAPTKELLFSETIWDVASNSWVKVTFSSNPNTPVVKTAATYVDDGMWLLAGGLLPKSNDPWAEMYVVDPSKNTVNKVGEVPPLASGSSTGRWGHQLTSLSGGKSILTGGRGADSVTKKVVLPDGLVHVFEKGKGWFNLSGENVAKGDTSFAYHAANALPDGRVLVTGGVTFDTEPEVKEGAPSDGVFVLNIAEAGGTFTVDKVQKMPQPRADHATVVVEDGSKRHVALVGGRSSGGKFVPFAQAECLASTMVCVWKEKQ